MSCFSSAGVRKGAWRDVGRSQRKPQPGDFPGSGNRTWGVRYVPVPPPPFFAPVLPGPGREVRSVLVWTSVQTTERSGVWWFRGTLKGQNVFLSFLQRETGQRKDRTTLRGRFPPLSSCSCSYAQGQGPAVGPLTGGAVLVTAFWVVEGHRTSDDAMVC